MHNPTINKYLYKIFLTCTKYIPIVISITFIINLTCNYCKVCIPFLSYFGGVSLLFLGLLYLLSWVFQFCHLYRIPLYYITIGNLIGVINKSSKHPIASISMYRFYFILTGIMLILYIWFMYKNRNNPKVAHAKQFLDKYCEC